MGPRTQFDVIVIGGGLSGLSCAMTLSDSGLATVVLEKDVEPGGRARSWRDPTTGDTVDIGPHVVHTGYANFLAFLGRLGTATNICWQPQPLMTVLTPHGPYALRRSVLLRAAQLYAERFSDPDGRLRATFEIVWLSGWAPHESQQKPLRPGSAKARLADALGVPEIGTGDKAGGEKP